MFLSGYILEMGSGDVKFSVICSVVMFFSVCTVEMEIDRSSFILISPTTALLLICFNVLNFQVSLPYFS
jgi:hypothetical protein